MLQYTKDTISNIKQELEFIWKVQRSYGLSGKMRIYSGDFNSIWKNKEEGFEFWFDHTEIDEAVRRIEIFYNQGVPEYSAFLLDPMVYNPSKELPRPEPIGTGIIWGTFLATEGKEFPDLSKKRIDGLYLFSDYITLKNPDGSELKKGGIKVVGFLKEPVKTIGNFKHESNPIKGMQELADLVDLDTNAEYNSQYILSGINYNGIFGQLSHSSFKEVFKGRDLNELEDVVSRNQHQKYIVDAGMCWNAYGRDQHIYERYGVDGNNLQSNLKRWKDSDAKVAEIKKELSLILRANEKAGLVGKMRVFAAPTQRNWRAKQAGHEIWFDKNSLDNLIKQLQYLYNGGILPNSPLLFDPLVYDSKTGEALGTVIVWTTGLFTGQVKYNVEAKNRMADLGFITGDFYRADGEISGIKAFCFTDKILKPEVVEKDTNPVSGCREVFDIINSNAAEFYGYYLLTGLEYLCSNGGFENFRLDIDLPEIENDLAQDKLIEEYTISHNKILDAARCWNQYDKLHPLWQKFGVDTVNLEKNLRFFNLCGRDLNLLSMTGDSREDGEEEFEFFAPGWIPKSAITVIGATGGTGKSSLAHRLAVIASIDWRDDEPNPVWLGSEIDKNNCKGLAVYFSGEDSAAIVNARARMFDPEGRSSRLLLKTGNDFGYDENGIERNIGHFLNYLHKLPDVSIVVIDPARKYLIGDEDNAEVVSQFFEAIERFAHEKKCAMVVVHHLKKEAHPKDTRDIVDLLRGSQVFIDRPRAVLGLMRDGAYTIAGLSKCNLPPQAGMVDGERVFVRDPERLDLLWLPGDEGVRRYTVSQEELKKLKEEKFGNKNE
jgi:hypothetical protein